MLGVPNHTLRCMQAEFESRWEMYEAQVTKMQRSLERGDDEKAKVEEQLAKAMALTAQGDKQVTDSVCQLSGTLLQATAQHHRSMRLLLLTRHNLALVARDTLIGSCLQHIYPSSMGIGLLHICEKCAQQQCGSHAKSVQKAEACCGNVQGLAALRDRLSMVVTGRASKTSQLEERLKV